MHWRKRKHAVPCFIEVRKPRDKIAMSNFWTLLESQNSSHATKCEKVTLPNYSYFPWGTELQINYFCWTDKLSFPAAQRHMCLSKKGYLSLQKYPPSWRTGTVACFQFLITPSVLWWLLNGRRFQPPCFDLALKVWLHLSLSVYLLMVLP